MGSAKKKAQMFVKLVSVARTGFFYLKRKPRTFTEKLEFRTEVVTRKSPVAWKKVCSQRRQGGLNILALHNWNRACLLKNVWNLTGKADSMWIRWVHSYYIKNVDILTIMSKQSDSWIMKSMLKVRDCVSNLQEWRNMLLQNKYTTRRIYRSLCDPATNVNWCYLMSSNLARPRAIHTLWMACHNSLATKERLCRFGMLTNNQCRFCNEIETQNHLLFRCHEMRQVWEDILRWLGIVHSSDPWETELCWIIGESRRKGTKARVLLCAFTETVHECWVFRNKRIFEDGGTIKETVSKIVDALVYRCWAKEKIRKFISTLMLEI